MRVAVIGCGFQGSYHAANVAAHPEVVLAVCCDLDQRLADDLGAKHQAAPSSDYSQVLEDPNIDAVIIATTTNTHASMAIAAAHHGKHILLEKPMAVSVAECRAIEDAVAATGVVLVVGYKFRFMASTLAAKQTVPNPVVLTAHTLYDFTQGTSSWVNERSLSGGRLMSSLVHSVDLLRFLADSEVTRVTAAGGNLVIDGLGDLDNVVATLEFENGAIASLVHGTAGESPLLSVWSFQTAGRGTNATIYAHGRRAMLHQAGRADPQVVDDPTADPFAAGTPELLQAFLDAIAVGGATSGGPRDGTLAVMICRAIEESVASGMPQAIVAPPD